VHTLPVDQILIKHGADTLDSAVSDDAESSA